MNSNSSPNRHAAPAKQSPKGMNFLGLRYCVAALRREKRIAKIELKIAMLVAVFAMLTLAAGLAAESVAPGQESAPALFNSGNAFVRQGKPGPAILAYERAQQLAPR